MRTAELSDPNVIHLSSGWWFVLCGTFTAELAGLNLFLMHWKNKRLGRVAKSAAIRMKLSQRYSRVGLLCLIASHLEVNSLERKYSGRVKHKFGEDHYAYSRVVAELYI